MTEPRVALQPLELASVLLTGRVLIEASAGTGKTWTIAALYVRLLLEQRLRVDQILVLTFTNAATAELRTRIRERLTQLRELLRADESARPDAPVEDALVAHVLSRYADHSVERSADARWLDAAIESFDLATIHTIHAFAQRALVEQAFDSGAPFEVEQIGDEGPLVEAAMRDCWRIDMRDATPLWATWLLEEKIDPVTLLARIKPLRERPDAQLCLPAAPSPLPEDDYVAAYAAARALWQRGAADALEIFAGWKSLRRTKYKRNHVLQWWVQIDASLQAEHAHLALAEKLERFTPQALSAECNDHVGPAHPLFDAFGALHAAQLALKAGFAARLACWQGALARELDVRLRAHKRARRLQSYADMLHDLHAALTGPGSAALAQRLRERHKVALIDEFQDTDPLQYAIFEAIYADSDALRCFVGDPKQSIYAFRGADVHLWLRARERAGAARTLDVNRRSVPQLVDAINGLYAVEDPFHTRGIGFPPATARATPATLEIDGATDVGLQCWFMARAADADGLISKGDAAAQAAAWTADDIAQLLAQARAGRAVLVEARDATPRAPAGGDIAVLVSTHVQAHKVKTALAERGVASVTYGADSVYRSEDALELARVLAAVLAPVRADLLRAALATRILGHDAAALNALAEDSAEWEELCDRFVGYAQRAREHGFIRMWRSLLAEEGVAARLLALPDGERRMTNLQHLADLLHAAAVESDADLESLLRLLLRSRESAFGDVEAQQLRLESDENLVRVLTVHAAKGLQFPIVYCPFLWDSRLDKKNESKKWPRFHTADGALVIDLHPQPQPDHRARAQAEALGERLRAAYVALTRACHRCIFVWGAIREAYASAPAWLLHGDATVAGEGLTALEPRFAALGDGALRAALDAAGARKGGAIALRTPPLAFVPAAGTLAAGAVQAADETPLHARSFAGPVPAPWRVSSFSGLTAAHAVGASRAFASAEAAAEREVSDHDRLSRAVQRLEAAEAAPVDSAFALPRGARLGTLVHALFEHMDFAHPQAVPVRAKLAEFGIEARWAPVLERLLADVVATPLRADGTLRLAQIARAQRLTELEFVYTVEQVRESALRAALAPLHAGGSRLPESIGSLVLAPARGYIRGFIDLVFEHEGRYCIADYKSNWLGNRHEDYGPDALARAMSEAFYDLQYLLYSVALHRHLRLRLPDYDYDRHFGGVYYLFVRGMSPAHGNNGVYATRPPRALIERLDALFARDAHTARCVA